MISEIKYFELIKKLPFQNPPKNINDNVLEKCGLAANISTTNRFEFIYSLACAVISLIILLEGLYYSIPSKDSYTIIAYNSKFLMSQLANGAYEGFLNMQK